MPQVPVYQQRVSQNAEPANQLKINYQAPTGVSQAINQGADLVTKATEAAAIAKANEGFLEYSRMHEELLSGKGAGDQSGLLQQRGFNALNASQKYQEEYQKRKSELLQKYDGIGRSRLESLIDKDYANDQKRINRHLGTEAMNYQDEGLKSLIQLNSEKALNNYQDADLFEAYKMQMLDTYEQAASLKGLPKEAVEIGKRTLNGNVYSQLMTKLTDSNRAKEAQAILEANRDILPSDVIAKHEKQIKIQEQKNSVMSLADDYEKMSYSAQQAKLKEIEDADVRKGVRDELSARRRDFESVQNFNRNQAKGVAVRQMVANGYKFDSLSPSLIASLDASDISSLRNMSKTAGSIQTDWGLYSEITRSLGKEGEKSKYANLDPMAFRDRLADSEFKGVVSMMNATKKGDTATVNTILTTNDIKDAALSAMKIDQKKNPELASEYMAGLQTYINQAAGGKKLTSPEIEDLAKKYNAKVIINKRFLIPDVSVPANKIDPHDPKQVNAVDLEDIPEETKALIRSSPKFQQGSDKEYLMKQMYLHLNSIKKGNK